MDTETIDHGRCPGCGETVRTTSVHSSGETVRMTVHIDAGEDPASRCRYDGGTFMGGPKRVERFPGDTYL